MTVLVKQLQGISFKEFCENFQAMDTRHSVSVGAICQHQVSEQGN